jgi:hypothetical protein
MYTLPLDSRLTEMDAGGFEIRLFRGSLADYQRNRARLALSGAAAELRLAAYLGDVATHALTA